MWHIGQKVVALKDSLVPGEITKGNIYVISDISVCQCGTSLHIHGIGSYSDNRCVQCKQDLNHGWKSGKDRYFAPLLGKEQDKLTAIEEAVEELELITI